MSQRHRDKSPAPTGRRHRQRQPRPDPLAEALQALLAGDGLGAGLSDLAALNRAWQEAAGPQWRSRSWVLGLRGSELEVGVASPAAASRLRFEAGSLAERMRRAGWPSVKGVRARVQPQAEQVERRRHRRYSEDAAAGVAQGAEEVADPELRAALQRLATRLGRPPGDTD
jgi:hypothetical protein